MKKEALLQARQAYITESECIMQMLNYFDEEVYSKAVELLPIVDICKKKGIRIIAITENLESPLALSADVVIKQYVNRETDKYNCQGTTSSTSLAVIFHVLQTALIEETDFQNEQFAVVHPGGAVGERLNAK